MLALNLIKASLQPNFQLRNVRGTSFANATPNWQRSPVWRIEIIIKRRVFHHNLSVGRGSVNHFQLMSRAFRRVASGVDTFRTTVVCGRLSTTSEEVAAAAVWKIRKN